MKKFYITTPIYYPNARPHIGSAYTTIACDAIARYKRMSGYDVAFLTGTDEHGEKLQRAADAAGVPVEQFVAEKRELFKKLWLTLGIPAYSADQPAGYRFVHTSQNAAHRAAVHWMIRQADKAGYIDKKKYEGRYCVFDERYVSDSTEPANCDICGRPAELIQEENYFFKLSAFQDKLLRHYEDHPEFVRPDFRMNEVKSFVKSGLRDISISRRRLKWGVPWPDDPNQVVYVWYDALTSYLSGIGFEGEKRGGDFDKYWMDSESERVHMIGKDILRFHAVYWPAFLWAAGLPLPNTIFAHGWIYYQQDKMSKSKGNVIYPEPIVRAFEQYRAPGQDAIRYYLLADTPFGMDGNFSGENLLQRYISDLANVFGNLTKRTLTMVHRHFADRVPAQWVNWEIEKAIEAHSSDPISLIEQYVSPAGRNFLQQSSLLSLAWEMVQARHSFVSDMDQFELFDAVRGVLASAKALDGELSTYAPWRLASSSFDANREKIATILYVFLESLRFIALMLAPFSPEGASRIWKGLGCEAYLGPIEKGNVDQLSWGELQIGTSVGAPETIFPHDDDKGVMLQRLREFADADRAVSETAKEITVESQPEPKAAPANLESQISNSEGQKITIDDFAKVDLRVGTVLSAESIPGATKLLKLQVDIGAEVRQICAGIAEFYKPEDLVGMKVVIVANLQPRKMRGVESNGMVVAASIGDAGRPALATFKEEVPNGSRLK